MRSSLAVHSAWVRLAWLPLGLLVGSAGTLLQPLVARAEGEAAAWMRFSPAGRGFTIDLPGTPEEHGSEGAYEARVRIGNGETQCTYLLRYLDVPESADPLRNSQGLVDAHAGEFVAQRKTTVKMLQEGVIKLAGHPGKQVTFEEEETGTKRFCAARFFLVKNRVYSMIVLLPSVRSTAVSGEGDRFLNSFELADVWVAYEWKEGRCAFEIPGTVAFSEAPFSVDGAGSLVAYSVSASTGTGLSFSVRYFDLPEAFVRGQHADLMKEVFDLAVGSQGRVTSRKDAGLEGHQGLEVTMEKSGAGSSFGIEVVDRVVLVDRRVYQMTVSMEKWEIERWQQPRRRFLDSFKPAK